MAERPSLRAEQVEGTRRAIVASARKLFGTKGYGATSVDDVAARARVTKGAVYHHFGNKEDLFRAVYAEVEAEAQSRSAATGKGGDRTPIGLIVEGVQGYLDATLDPEVRRITLIDGPAVLGPEPEGRAEDQPGHLGLRAFIAAAIDGRAIIPVDPDALAHLIRGACMQAGLLIARSDDPSETRARLGETLEAMIRGLGPR